MRVGRRRRAVRMHLAAGPTIDGLLLARHAGHYVLGAASVIQDEEMAVDVGEVRIPVGRVLFYQVLA